MVKNSILLMTAVAGILAINACSKSDDDDNTTPTKTKTELLTSASWKVEDAGVDNNKDGVINQSIVALYPCISDNVYTFKSDKTGTVNEGTTVCSGSASGSFTWTFKNSETVINAAIPPLSGDISIHHLDENSMVVYKDTVITTPLPLGNVWMVVKLKH